MFLFAPTIISNMDNASSEKELVLNAINEIRKKSKKRPDKDRLVSHLSSKFDIPADDALKMIDGLNSEGSIRLETYADGSTSYFISSTTPSSSLEDSSQTATSLIQENSQINLSDLSPPGDDTPHQQDHFYEDLLDFKKYMHGELLGLKALISNKSISEPNKSSPAKSLDYERLLIKSMEDRITSLERQLAYKQAIIDKLLESPRPENKALHIESQLCPSRPLPSEGQKLSSDPIEPRTMASGEMNGSETTPKKNRKRKNQSPGVNKVASDGKSLNEPKKGLNESEPGNANASSDSKVAATQQQAPIKKIQQQEKERKRVYVLGDSIINGIEEKGLSRNHIVKVRKYPGDNTEDMIDHVKPIIRKKPDLIIVHFGTNDITAEKDTDKNTQKVIDMVKAESPDTEIAVSLCTVRKDKQGFAKKVDSHNAILREVATRNNVYLIDNKNIDDTGLGMKKLHLNRKGTSFLANNFKNFINDI